MRIWHKDLLSVLPRQQLLGQWRECCLIAKNIVEKGTPNHILVNRVMDYPIEHFLRYGELIYFEMHKRGFNSSLGKFVPYLQEKPCDFETVISYESIFDGWHNTRYLRQCLYNLQEKYDCGGISQEEWDKIKEKFADRFDIIW